MKKLIALPLPYRSLDMDAVENIVKWVERVKDTSKYLVVLLVSSMVAIPLSTLAEVDKDSIFREAQSSVSELDVKLAAIQKSWWTSYVTSPDDKSRQEHPLITQSGMGISLDYFGDDRISATGVINDVDGFLKLSAEERKQLVLNTLDLVKQNLSFPAISLVDKKTGRLTGEMIGNHHIALEVLFNHVTRDDKGGNIRMFLPNEMGVGSAGYKDRQFVFSEAYFLDLKVHDGLAVSGDPSKFVFERE